MIRIGSKVKLKNEVNAPLCDDPLFNLIKGRQGVVVGYRIIDDKPIVNFLKTPLIPTIKVSHISSNMFEEICVEKRVFKIH